MAGDHGGTLGDQNAGDGGTLGEQSGGASKEAEVSTCHSWWFVYTQFIIVLTNR